MHGLSFEHTKYTLKLLHKPDTSLTGEERQEKEERGRKKYVFQLSSVYNFGRTKVE
jgi:hypothetical protein